jgi:hypothetical protein
MKSPAGGEMEELIKKARDVKGVKLVAAIFKDRSMDDLKTLAVTRCARSAQIRRRVGPFARRQGVWRSSSRTI